MHDFFDILGLPHTVPAVEVRRICARRIRRWHPDFRPGGSLPVQSFPAAQRDAAVDFAEMSTFVDRIQAAFFVSPR